MNDDLSGLRFGPIKNAVHLCVDMQRLFSDDTDWKTPWMERVLPNVVRITAASPARTIFTRFIPARKPGKGNGAWKRYWKAWPSMTLSELAPGMTDLVADLAHYAPPATVIDKSLYSPWIETDLRKQLKRHKAETVIVTGGETDVCVLATVLGAIDRGYRVIVVTDALCSSSDETHDALMTLYHRRYSQQVETVLTNALMTHWRP